MSAPFAASLLGALAGLSVAAVGCRSSPVRSAEAPGWYAAGPLLSSLRPAARAGLEGRLGVRALEDVTLYDLDASVDLAGAKMSLQEEAWITVPDGETWPDLVLRLYANVPAARSGKAPPMRFVTGTCAVASRPGACAVTAESAVAIRVRPDAPLGPGTRVRVSLTLAADIERIDGSRTSLLAQGLEGMQSIAGAGEGAGNYGVLGLGDGIASFGNFYAVLARRTAAGWERADKSALGDLGSDDMSHVRARIDLPLAAKLASSGVTITDEPSGPGRHAVRVAAAAVRDFAFVAGEELDVATAKAGDVVVSSWFRRADRAAGERVLGVAALALEDYERRFGPYPYPRLAVAEAAIVGGAGGVEFSGLVTIASMFYKSLPAAGPGAAGAGPMGALTDSMLEFVVAHEVAHQLWHGLVGSDSRDHPFMDEALAQYSALVYLEDRYGKERAEQDGMLNVKANYQMMRLLGSADAPADQPVDAFASPMAYAGVVYGKAPYFFAAVRKALGDAAFFGDLRAYTEKYAFRVAPEAGLLDAFGPGDARVAALGARWLRENHGDEDLGKADLAKMIGSMLDPESAKELAPLLRSLGGGGDASGVDLKALLKQLTR